MKALDEALGRFAWWRKIRGGDWAYAWRSFYADDVRYSERFWCRYTEDTE